MIEIKVPVLPESISEAAVALWHKKVGDFIRVDDVLVEIETDKVVLEIPSDVDGIMEEILEKEKSVVKEGQILAYVTKKDLNDIEVTKKVSEQKISVPAGVAARKAMAENSITRDEVVGSGKGGRILKEDVIANTKQKDAIKQIPKTSISERLEERVPMSSLRKTIASRLLNATQQTVMLTTFNELDMSSVMDIRKQYKETFAQTHGVKLGFMSFFVKATVEALKRFPTVNAYIDGDDITYHGYCDIGVAVSSERGLVVPVLRDAHKMTLSEIETNIMDFATRAQSGKLSLDEITGGTFTISNGGAFGSMLSTPILNPPQSGILGMHNIESRAVVVDGEIVVRPIMYLALSYDHRIIDGKEAVLFLRSIKDNLADPRRLLLDL